jgi:hypothetical protein
MSPREMLEMVAAVHRWASVHELRCAASREKREAEQKYKEMPDFRVTDGLASMLARDAMRSRISDASAAVTATRREERRAMKALAALSAKARGKFERDDLIELSASEVTPASEYAPAGARISAGTTNF